MKYAAFKKQITGFPVFSSKQITALGGNVQVLKNQLTAWKSKGLLIRLKKSLYVLNDVDRRITPSRVFLANQIYQPSYVSTEYALHFHDLIPERVADVTSVSPRKSATFENHFGRFVYQQVKRTCFTGYRMLEDENDLNVLIAEPEKALIDFLYLNLSRFTDPVEVLESLRLQNVETLRKNRLDAYARLCGRAKLLYLVQGLIRHSEAR